ncbi:uncharacterized protein CTHT_0040500 [Thermochaetoides thermophila DSM 1495]|uniref:Mannose-6-phosphate isomerase n=1 Tax=Chaetomium thermophilum (strain DSM 1495 / CBS 144.50 / IMI 039719) TaxID=759272 RepID=G0SA00_CHATD|nr:hypothetical protein CTHT_0040500 [Thermochaetoides thermophila DSM 1495]EGS19572.1 hypothetical protein CTHT_0040500 [Thermochaetoides thermophila DSM 1495]
MQIPLIQLQCGANSYDWGKQGRSSLAARFAAATAADFTIQDDTPYAELWMGTHPSNPSKDVLTGRTLLDLVQDNQALLSTPIVARYGAKLPFLFKVLSINKALSIQAHPNKKLAEELHARDPKNYPDDNHKPEMAIALTNFEGLCGFRPLGEIVAFLEALEPLRELVGEEKVREFVETIKSTEGDESEEAVKKNKAALRAIFSSLMSSPEEKMKQAADKLVVLATETSFSGLGLPDSQEHPPSLFANLVLKLHTQFGPDYGLFVLFFLNYVTLSPGEAIFLRADDIHAYLSGDIVECMANSDNVVRAGLTPKFKDVDTLVNMLTYDYAPIEQQKMQPTEYAYATLNRAGYSFGSEIMLYDPPIEEFSVVRTVLRGPGAKATFDPLEGPSIVICVKGEGYISVGPKRMELKEGQVFFVGATAECVLQTGEGIDGEEEFVTFKAFCEVEDVEVNRDA